ncbi:P-loop NTPase fold protein [Empedobacter sp.]|uniref:P-loop NTPase fold protein n=1 Tax=Empedobacter sp. TaxID=1927715 RepID=UPI0028B2472A|nr:P-loop NTPase fold protein [Empedobacter sp.]
MTVKEELKISNDSIISQFKNHLKEDINERILLSGPFGSGKSTFINEFEEINKKDFFFIKLYPVNYSVSSNEDIFELIKFDILFELLTKYTAEIQLEKDDYTFWIRSWMFLTNRMEFFPIFHSLLSMHEKIGKPVADFLSVMKKTISDFKAYSDEIKIDEFQDVSDFMDSIIEKQGSPFEMDSTSKFIFDIISNRLKSDSKKVVLVIDDLDRLDPDHIFRLFNIFSAHTHSITGENKFGFDKVVFICDIENIRKIYKHKYGSGVDFEGYIDKFYSTSPFIFDNFIYISDILHNYIEKINLFGCDTKILNNDSFKISLKVLLKILLYYKKINLRTIVSKFDFNIENNTIYSRPNEKKTIQFESIIIFSILKDYLGGWSNLETILKELSFINESNAFQNNNFGDNKLLLTNYDIEILIDTFFLLLVMNPDNNIFNSDNYRDAKSYMSNELERIFDYEISNRNYMFYSYNVKVTKDGTGSKSYPNIYKFINNAFENLKKFDIY